MNWRWKLCRVAALVAMCSAAPFAWGAAPEGIEPEMPALGVTAVAPSTGYQLETEMVVRNWVLCVSQAVAEQLVQAREESVEKARSAYANLKQVRACGKFAEMRVILREKLYASSAESGHDARVFGALVNLSDSWASAFVVYGGLPEE